MALTFLSNLVALVMFINLASLILTMCPPSYKFMKPIQTLLTIGFITSPTYHKAINPTCSCVQSPFSYTFPILFTWFCYGFLENSASRRSDTSLEVLDASGGEALVPTVNATVLARVPRRMGRRFCWDKMLRKCWEKESLD